MSLNKSLRIHKFKNKRKSVLKRRERIQHLLDKGKELKDIDIFHLPKEKVMRIKIVKSKKKKPAENLTKLIEGEKNVQEQNKMQA